MRTTLELDDDIYMHAREVARVERVSIGKVATRWMRTGAFHVPADAPGESRSGRAELASPYVFHNGIPMIPFDPTSKRVVTQELIDRIRDEEGI